MAGRDSCREELPWPVAKGKVWKVESPRTAGASAQVSAQPGTQLLIPSPHKLFLLHQDGLEPETTSLQRDTLSLKVTTVSFKDTHQKWFVHYVSTCISAIFFIGAFKSNFSVRLCPKQLKYFQKKKIMPGHPTVSVKN